MTTIYKGYRINAGNQDQHPMHQEILEHIYKRFYYITNQLSQVYIVRFDLHLPDQNTLDPLDENKFVSEFFNRLIHKKMKKGKISHSHVVYGWVREVEKSKKAHYHCWIAVDRHKLNSVGSLKKRSGFYGLLLKTWSSVSSGGHVQIASGAPFGLHVRTQQEREVAFYALSYLAKCRGKGVRHGTSVRDYGGSCL